MFIYSLANPFSIPQAEAEVTLGLLEAFPGMPLKANCFSQSTPIGLDCLGWKRCISSSCKYELCFRLMNFPYCPLLRFTWRCQMLLWLLKHLKLGVCDDVVSLTKRIMIGFDIVSIRLCRLHNGFSTNVFFFFSSLTLPVHLSKHVGARHDRRSNIFCMTVSLCKCGRGAAKIVLRFGITLTYNQTGFKSTIPYIHSLFRHKIL